MATYKEQMSNKKSYVLLKDCDVLGTFGNLKKVCDFLDGEDFYSYNTIIRKKNFPIIYGNFKVFKTKHY